jgi:hypothetical protein
VSPATELAGPFGRGFSLALQEEQEFARPSARDGRESVPFGLEVVGRYSWVLPGRGAEDVHVGCREYATWGHYPAGSSVPDWRRGRRGCGTYDCPVDLSAGRRADRRWRNGYTTRQARRIFRRLGKRSNHLMVSPPSNWREIWRAVKAHACYRAWCAAGSPGRRRREPAPVPPARTGPCPPPESPREYRMLREISYRILERVGVARGAVFPHPYRCVGADRDGGHEGFHFHVQSSYLVDPERVARNHAETGWVVRGFGFRSTLRVALYELHHVGRLGRPKVPLELRADQLAREARSIEWDLPRLEVRDACGRQVEPSGHEWMGWVTLTPDPGGITAGPIYRSQGDDLSELEGPDAVLAVELDDVPAVATLRARVRHLREEARSLRETARRDLAQRNVGFEPGRSNPAHPDNLRYANEAVTWFGEWETMENPDSSGIVCPVCGETVPVRDWVLLSWVGQGPPPTEDCGRGGEWREDSQQRREVRP